LTAFTDILLVPLLPPVVLAVLAGAVLLLAAFGLWWRVRGTGARLVPALALLLVLVNPQGLVERRAPLSDVAVVVVDESASNRLGDRADSTESALDALRESLGGQPDLDLRVVRVEDGVGDQGTRLMTAVAGALADVPLDRRAGVIALTDGQVHDAGALSAEGLGAPFHLLLTGRPEERDRRLEVDAAPGYGLVGRSVPVTLRLEDPALAEGTPVPVQVRADGRDRGTVMLPANRADTLSLPLDHAGDTVFEVTAPAVPDEITDRNNRAALTVSGVRDRLRVLLVSGEPHAGERVWRNLLKADPGVDLVHFTILRPPTKDDSTPLKELALIAFPIRELFQEQLDNFDLVIFDRYSRRGLVPRSYLANVADYVRDGGALLLAVGPETTDPVTLTDSELASVLPIGPNRAVVSLPFQPQPTAEGRRHPVTADLPGLDDGPDGAPSWGRWVRLIDVQPTGGRTLLTGAGGRPVLHLARSGEGRVGLLLSDTSWLWSKGFEGGGPEAELLRRLAHWLMKEPDLEEEALVARAEGDRLEITRRGMDSATLPDSVTLTGPDGRERVVPLEAAEPGRATASVVAGQPGVTVLDDGTFRTVVVVGTPNPQETDRVTATDTILGSLAAVSGGAVVWLPEEGPPTVRRVAAGSPAAGAGWIGLRANRAYTVQGVDRTPLLPAWLAIVLVLGGFGWAWWREGR